MSLLPKVDKDTSIFIQAFHILCIYMITGFIGISVIVLLFAFVTFQMNVLYDTLLPMIKGVFSVAFIRTAIVVYIIIIVCIYISDKYE